MTGVEILASVSLYHLGLRQATGVYCCPGTTAKYIQWFLENGLGAEVSCNCNDNKPDGERKGELVYFACGHVVGLVVVKSEQKHGC